MAPVLHLVNASAIGVNKSCRMMARRRSFRRRSTVPKPRIPREITWGQFAAKAWQGVKQIKTLINVEEHRVDTTIGASINNAGAVTHMTAIAGGSTAVTRTGSSILLKSFHMRFALLKHASATQTVMRVILVRDKQQISDTTPAVLDILNSADPMSHIVPDYQERWSIVKDVTFVFDAAHVLRTFDWRIPRTGLHVRYNGTAGTDIQQGGHYLLLLSNEATNTPTASVISRCRFYDN